jgi:hypothetical protein
LQHQVTGSRSGESAECKRVNKLKSKTIALLTKTLQSLQMSFDIEDHLARDGSGAQSTCFDTFEEVLSSLVIGCFGGRLFESLESIFVDGLDLAENFIKELQEAKSKDDAIKKQRKNMTPQKSTKQD